MLMGLLLLVFVKQNVDVELMATAQTTAGILGVVGNKGAVGIALKHKGHRMAFVCAHLAAGRGKTKERNQNVSKIMEVICVSVISKGVMKVRFALEHHVRRFSTARFTKAEELITRSNQASHSACR